MKIFSQSQKYSVAAPRHPRGVGPRLEPVSGGGVHEVAGSPREVDLGGGEPVHVGDDGAGPGDVERGLAAPEQRRDGGHVRLRLPGRHLGPGLARGPQPFAGDAAVAEDAAAASLACRSQ